MRLLILLLLFLFAGCSKPEKPYAIQKDIDSLVRKFVPDSREGLCTLSLSELPGKKIVIKGETDLPEAKSEIMNYILKKGFEISDSLIILPDTSVIRKKWGIVSVSAGNMKKAPSHPSELLSQVIMGTPVKILKKKGGWIMVQSPDYYIGWINDSGIEEMSDGELSRWKKSERVIYLKNIGTIFSESDPKVVVSDIVLGSVVEKNGEDLKYIHIVLPDGRKGVVAKSDVSDFRSWSDKITPEAEELVSLGKTFLGTPYLWGGTSSKAFDCSGFMKTLYFVNGIILARDASLQFLHGKQVEISSSLDSLKPGDLIFFGTKTNGKKRISHVGMYIGNTEVLHCSGMVRINSLDPSRPDFSDYLKSGVMGARRIIGTESARGTERIRNYGWYF